MNWQIEYVLKYISKNHSSVSTEHVQGDAIRINMPSWPETIMVISEADTINSGLAKQYHASFPDMAFLCGYRRECVWEGEAIAYLEDHQIGWGSAGTMYSAIRTGGVRNVAHKDYVFAHRLIRQMRSIKSIKREFDRVLTITLASGRTLRVGMIMEYEPTADAIRTFWDRFGPIDIAWNINPNGKPTTKAVEAGATLGCKVVKWQELKDLLEQ